MRVGALGHYRFDRDAIESPIASASWGREVDAAPMAGLAAPAARGGPDTPPPNRFSTAGVGGELARACRGCLSGRGGGRRADTECGAEHDLGVADIVQLDLASHVLGDPRGYDLAAGLGVGTRVPDTE